MGITQRRRGSGSKAESHIERRSCYGEEEVQRRMKRNAREKKGDVRREREREGTYESRTKRPLPPLPERAQASRL